MDDYNDLFSEMELDYSDVVVYRNGRLHFAKPMADDGDTREQEKHVLDLFCRSYAKQRYDVESLDYSIVADDTERGHMHDFTVQLAEPRKTLEVEITRIGESEEVFMSHELRRTALEIANEYAEEGVFFFAFLPFSTRARDLRMLFEDASRLDVEEIPGKDDHEALSTFVKPLVQAGKPYIRVCTNDHFQVHTSANKSRYLREIVQDAVRAKEAKNYGEFSQKNMILLLDDRLLDYDRNDIDKAQPFLANEHAASVFKEIHIISRKTSFDTTGEGRAEFMVTPIKAVWNKPLFEARVRNIHELQKIRPAPFSY